MNYACNLNFDMIVSETTSQSVACDAIIIIAGFTQFCSHDLQWISSKSKVTTLCIAGTFYIVPPCSQADESIREASITIQSLFEERVQVELLQSRKTAIFSLYVHAH